MSTPSLDRLSEVVSIAAPATAERVNVLGVAIHPLDMESATATIQSSLLCRVKGYICLVGVHGVMEAQHNPELRAVFANALLVSPDGMPTVWMGRLQGFKQIQRVSGPDMMIEVMRRPEFAGYTHFLCGGDYGVAEDLSVHLSARFPAVQIVGTYTPPFRPMLPDEEAELQELVHVTRPDIVWVGLSTPKQDLFMAQYLPLLDTTLMIGVGAAFLFHTGRIHDSPQWVKRAGLQWLHRLIQEPTRLWKRYLFANSRFIAKILLQLTGLKRYPADAGIQTEKTRSSWR